MMGGCLILREHSLSLRSIVFNEQIPFIISVSAFLIST
jgi:hypothetical protein